MIDDNIGRIVIPKVAIEIIGIVHFRVAVVNTKFEPLHHRQPKAYESRYEQIDFRVDAHYECDNLGMVTTD